MSKAFPRWKYGVLGFILLVSIIYALPNLYGEVPAVQISGLKGQRIEEYTELVVQKALEVAELPWDSIEEQDNSLVVVFQTPDQQLKAKTLIKKALGERYSVALNLLPRTPEWLRALGAEPMKLGLDLRGGVHFLMEVDVEAAIQRRLEDYFVQIPKTLREEKLYYSQVTPVANEKFFISFLSEEARDKAQHWLQKEQYELLIRSVDAEQNYQLSVELSLIAVQQIRRETMDQSLAILRNRVNELGVAEAIVQRQGMNRIIVELPGVQDTAYAKDILGKTATLKFLMEDHEHDLEQVLKGDPVVGSKLYFDRYGRPSLLKTRPILTGGSISGASTGQDQNGQPSVSVRLSGDISRFTKMTKEVARLSDQERARRKMGVIYVEVKDGSTYENLISLAVIQSALGNQFQITGLSITEARDLALLLRAGALPAPISIVEESIVGPSMGQENIEMGMLSVGVGLLLVLVFMSMYYSVMGVIANIALMMNLVLLVAVMSLIGATLTLPGIAGIVLTLGMAVDASVLIFERIREELRAGMSPRASVHRGFEFAFATIIDSNLTTLIVGIVLFAIGTGPVKGFAVTLSLGILTSLLTATMGTRAMVELMCGRKQIRKIRVGI